MSAARKDVSPGFSADDDPAVTRAQLRQRKLDRLRSSQAADEDVSTVAEMAEILAAREPTTVVKHAERLEFRRAAADAEPAEQLRHYERTIGDAQSAVQGMLQAAHEQWVMVAGQALREVRDGRLFTHAGYESFDGYVQARWNIQRAHAYRLIDAAPVVRALSGTVRSELKERQMRALVPVGRRHGDQAVRDVWAEAERRGRTSGAGLEEVAGILGYGESVAESAAQTPAPAAAVVPAPRRDSVAALRRAWSRFDARTIREAAGQDPEEVRRIVAELRGVLDEVELHLGAVGAVGASSSTPDGSTPDGSTSSGSTAGGSTAGGSEPNGREQNGSGLNGLGLNGSGSNGSGWNGSGSNGSGSDVAGVRGAAPPM